MIPEPPKTLKGLIDASIRIDNRLRELKAKRKGKGLFASPGNKKKDPVPTIVNDPIDLDALKHRNRKYPKAGKKLNKQVKKSQIGPKIPKDPKKKGYKERNKCFKYKKLGYQARNYKLKDSLYIIKD